MMAKADAVVQQQASHDASSQVRRHTPQISISDDNYHVTEAICSIYDYDDDDYLATSQHRSSRPLSFVESANEADQLSLSYLDTKRSSPPRFPLQQTSCNERPPSSDYGLRKGSLGSECRPMCRSSPPPLPSRKSLSSVAETAVRQFSLNDIDYESSPAAVAQELIVLRAIRRMSMSVDNAGPNIPSFRSPTCPKPVEDNEASRLFWVPARLHPELAPKEFKNLVEERVVRIQKRSGSYGFLIPGAERTNSDSSLTRKKSILSRQIDSSTGHEDGAKRLQRKRSESSHEPASPIIENIQDLEGLVGIRGCLDSADDAPILPSPGPTLKRSTRTNTRKDRMSSFRRLPGRSSESESDSEGPRTPSASLSAQEFPTSGVTRVQTGPSRVHGGNKTGGGGRFTSLSSEDLHEHQNCRTTAAVPGASNHLLQIVETPSTKSYNILERRSSHVAPVASSSSQSQQQQDPPRPTCATRRSRSRLGLVDPASSRSNKFTIEDIFLHPSPLPGCGSTKTDALTMIPFYEEMRVEKKDSRKTSWNWLLGSEREDRVKERKTEDDERESDAAKRFKAAAKIRHKTGEKTRRDVLQQFIDSNAIISKGRESLVIDRDTFKLDGDRRKEGSWKSTESGKINKDSGVLSAIFGGGNRSTGLKLDHNQTPVEPLRATSRDSTPRMMRPDTDYSWTRFSVREELAIYRMARVKLASSGRPLHSQVLLSNFMFRYLAKVQMKYPTAPAPVAQETAQARWQQQQQQIRLQQAQQDASRVEDRQSREQSKYQRGQVQNKSSAVENASAGAKRQSAQDAPNDYLDQRDYLRYPTDASPSDYQQNSGLWQDEESNELWRFSFFFFFFLPFLLFYLLALASNKHWPYYPACIQDK